MLRKFFAFAVAALVLMPVQAQLIAEWGSIDERYPVDFETPVRNTGVNSATAWRGERVNFQMLVANRQDTPTTPRNDREVSYRFSELKSGRNVIPATNVAGGFVQHVITGFPTRCFRKVLKCLGTKNHSTSLSLSFSLECQYLTPTFQLPFKSS